MFCFGSLVINLLLYNCYPVSVHLVSGFSLEKRDEAAWVFPYFYQWFYIIFVPFISVDAMDKKLLLIPGYLVGCGGLLLITIRTLAAVVSEQKTVILHVNRFGEQYLDLLLLGLLWIVCVIGLWSLTRMLREQGSAQRHSDDDCVAAPHASSVLFDDHTRVPLITSGRRPLDTLGYLPGEDADRSFSSVSVVVLQENLSEGS